MRHIREFVLSLRATLRRRWFAAPERVRNVAPYFMVLLVGVFIGSTVINRLTAPHGGDDDGIRAANGEDGSGDGVEWTCSMHPQVRQPGPGNCPICGMSLIPVATGDDNGEHGDLPRLVVSERAAALMAVQVWPVERMSVAGDVRLSGTIGYDETLVHDVVVRTEGQVERLFVNYENAAVSRGQRLADIYSPAVQAASLELLQARRAAQAGGMADLVEAAASQLLALGVTRAQVDRILETGQPVRTLTVFSPGDGIVSELGVRQGEWLMAGGRVMRIAGLGRVWVQFDAFERDLARLRVGSPMQFTVEAFPGQVFTGNVTFIDPIVDGARRTARVRVQVANPGGRLKPGMLARGTGGGPATGAGAGAGAGASATAASAPLVIPASAPLLTGRRALVYVQLAGTERPTFEARDVTLGERKGAWWEVTDGLAEGELVVVNGAFRIDSELQIRGRPSMMAGEQRVTPTTPRPDSRAIQVRLSDAGGRELERVVTAYLDVTGALASDDAAAARTASRALEQALRAADLGELSGAPATDWRRLRDDMRGHASRMGGTSDIALIRRELVPVSTHLEHAVRIFASDRVGTLFRAVCPMVEGREGSWLTRVQAVENPYWGAEMFDCGEVEGKVAG
jgi:membrane fusion protein, copper/silver efflux system